MTRYSWGDLPAEIQLMVLERLSEAEYDDGASLVGYSIVSQAWQPVFERLTFRELYVTSSEFEEFQTIFRGVRRRYIQFIGLTLEFAQHEQIPAIDGSHKTKEDIALGHMVVIATHGIYASPLLPVLEREQTESNITLTYSLWVFLSQLSFWNRNEAYKGGMALEIMISSPSLSQKMGIRTKRHPSSPPTSIPQDIWRRYIKIATFNFHFALDFDFTRVRSTNLATFPKVEVISKVFIQKRAVLSFEPSAIAVLLQCFPSITEFELFVWPRLGLFDKELTINRWIEALDSWPSSLKTVRINQIGPLSNGPIRNTPCLTLFGQKLAYLCQQLDQFYVPFSIDAQAFFSTNVRQWSSLERLILWSTESILDELPSTANMLIRSAAYATLRMPSIKFLATYCLDAHRGGIFSYEVVNKGVRISVMCSHPFRLDEGCKKAWESVAREHNQGFVEWRIAELPVHIINLCVGGVLKRHPIQRPVRARCGRHPKR